MPAWPPSMLSFPSYSAWSVGLCVARAIAEHSQGSSPNFPSATKQRYIQTRSHIFTGDWKVCSNEDMIADLTTRPGSLWRKLTIHDVMGLGVCPARYSLDFGSQIRTFKPLRKSSDDRNLPPAKPVKLKELLMGFFRLLLSTLASAGR